MNLHRVSAIDRDDDIFCSSGVLLEGNAVCHPHRMNFRTNIAIYRKFITSISKTMHTGATPAAITTLKVAAEITSYHPENFDSHTGQRRHAVNV